MQVGRKAETVNQLFCKNKSSVRLSPDKESQQAAVRRRSSPANYLSPLVHLVAWWWCWLVCQEHCPQDASTSVRLLDRPFPPRPPVKELHRRFHWPLCLTLAQLLVSFMQPTFSLCGSRPSIQHLCDLECFDESSTCGNNYSRKQLRHGPGT